MSVSASVSPAISPISLAIASLPHFAGLPLPDFASDGAAGFDLAAAIDGDKDMLLSPQQRARVPTGLIFAIPTGYEGQIRPRSGLAHHHGITLMNAPATIDSDYRGEVQVLLINLGDQPFTIRRGMRIAQMLIAPVIPVQFQPMAVHDMPETARGSAGFGSSGYHSKPPTSQTKKPL